MTITKYGHVLHLEIYNRPALCDLCGKQLWGIIYHGYQCSGELNTIHISLFIPIIVELLSKFRLL